MRSSNVLRIFILLSVTMAATASRADYLCPLPFWGQITCDNQQGCRRTVYVRTCGVMQNLAWTCADFGMTVECCGSQLPTYSQWPCYITPLTPTSAELLVERFGRQRVFVQTCSQGYRRLGSDTAPKGSAGL